MTSQVRPLKLADAAPADVREILDDLRRIVRVLRESSRSAEAQAGVTGAQLFVLAALAHAEGALSVNELAARTHTHQSTVSVVAKRLIEAGLAGRRADREDRRRVEVWITPRGRAVLERAPDLAQRRIIDGLVRMNPALRSALVRGLSSLVATLGLGADAPGMFFEEEERSGRKAATPRGARKSAEKKTLASRRSGAPLPPHPSHPSHPSRRTVGKRPPRD